MAAGVGDGGSGDDEGLAGRSARLLVTTPVVLNPAAGVTAARIVVRPVNDTAAIVPLKLTKERYGIANPERRYSWCKIDVVRNEHRAAWRDFDDKALMATAVVVVGQNACDRTAAANLVTRLPVGNSGRGRTRRRRIRRRALLNRLVLVSDEDESENQ